MATRSTPAAAATAPNYTGPFITVAVLFLIFGFITNLNMALVPHLRNIFTLPYAWAMLAESAFFLAYFVFSSPTSKLIETIGYKRTMVVSLFIQVVGCLLFVPAAKLVSFPLFLTAVFIVGAGVTALQTAANPYVAILGPEHSAPVRLTLAQALNSFGGAVAPIIAGHFILTDPAKMASQAAVANTVRGPYLAIAGGLLILGIAVAFMHLPHISQTQEFRPGKEGDSILERSIWSYKHTVLGAIGIFLYVGVEVGLASIAVNYFLNQGINEQTAARVSHYIDSLGGFGHLITYFFGPWSVVGIAAILVSLYWIGALIGRLLGSWVLTKIKSNMLLGAFGFIAASLLVVSMVSSGLLAIWTVVLCGFFNSIMFPNIFALAIKGLGPMTSKGSGLVMTAVVGGAVIPPLIGAAADRVGIQHAFFIPIFCYVYIAYYGLWGSKPSRTVTT
ncbi:MAG TPA: sugar MFS transporter [Terracidiphilus sp.]|jgi:FHS family L-fucose permease-like MFS transporter